jgi:hypothetical protein
MKKITAPAKSSYFLCTCVKVSVTEFKNEVNKARQRVTGQMKLLVWSWKWYEWLKKRRYGNDIEYGYEIQSILAKTKRSGDTT